MLHEWKDDITVMDKMYNDIAEFGSLPDFTLVHLVGLDGRSHYVKSIQDSILEEAVGFYEQ